GQSSGGGFSVVWGSLRRCSLSRTYLATISPVGEWSWPPCPATSRQTTCEHRRGSASSCAPPQPVVRAHVEALLRLLPTARWARQSRAACYAWSMAGARRYPPRPAL